MTFEAVTSQCPKPNPATTNATETQNESLAAGEVRSDHDGSMKNQSTNRERRRPMILGQGETEPSQSPGGGRMAAVSSAATAAAARVTFDRRELDRIFGLYGRKVAEGEWRDYAIDFLNDRAVFSVFQRSCEVPIYRIEKNPKLARRQGAYSVI
jgi:Protein of unknown function (DUF2794)